MILRAIGFVVLLGAVISGISLAVYYVWNDRDDPRVGSDVEAVGRLFDGESEPGARDFGIRIDPGLNQMTEAVLRVTFDDLVDWSTGADDDDSFSELVTICGQVLVAASETSHLALAAEGFCRDVLFGSERSLDEWRERATERLPSDDYPSLGIGWYAVEAQRRRLRNWANAVQSGREIDVDYVVRLCMRYAPSGFNTADSPPDASAEALGRRIAEFCGEVLANPDARTPPEWAAIIDERLADAP
jgi:hypothetical protein